MGAAFGEKKGGGGGGGVSVKQVKYHLPTLAADLVSHASRLPSLSSRLDNRSVMSSSSITTSHVATSHPETMIVTLVADDIGYGMSLQGGTTERGVYPILIASIMEGGPAAK